MDSVENLFLKSWRQEDYIPGDTLPDWVEIPGYEFREILFRFARLLTDANCKPAKSAICKHGKYGACADCATESFNRNRDEGHLYGRIAQE